MKKKSIGIMFLSIFLKSFLLIMIILVVGVGSYQLTKMYYKAKEKKVEGGEKVLDIVGDITTGDISLNLIYSVDEESGRIQALVLEIFNINTHNLDYITIPSETRFTVSNDMYQRLYVLNPETPQIVQMSLLKTYFEGDAAYEYGIILLEDYFGIDIGYYTAMNKPVFNKLFEVKENGAYTLSAQTFQKTSSFTDEDSLGDYIKDKYNYLTSNLKIKTKLKYVPEYLNIQKDKIYSYKIEGNMANGYYEADAKSVKRLYDQIIKNAAYKIAQTESEKLADASKGLNIEILNGSRITGLAAITKDMLTEEGYTVASIGDYSGDIIETTKIYVRKKGMGKDLIRYFNSPDIETKKLDDGVDIQIVLGTADKVQ